MNKLNLFLSIFIITLTLIGCKKENGPDPDPVVKLGVVINEIMSVNSNTVKDQNGEYDDWIELYNLSDTIVDLSGYYLSDSKSDLSKWSIPPGTNIQPDSSIIIWADADTLQLGLHANYKLSSTGETVVFLTPELTLIDIVKFGEKPVVIGQPIVDKSYGRIPNGTGLFEWTIPTFNKKNI
jgi:hypothetical protein